jgi:hypothetical protein
MAQSAERPFSIGVVQLMIVKVCWGDLGVKIFTKDEALLTLIFPKCLAKDSHT